MTDIVLAILGACALVWEVRALWSPHDKHKTVSERLRAYNKASDGLVLAFLAWLVWHLFLA